MVPWKKYKLSLRTCSNSEDLRTFVCPAHWITARRWCFAAQSSCCPFGTMQYSELWEALHLDSFIAHCLRWHVKTMNLLNSFQYYQNTSSKLWHLNTCCFSGYSCLTKKRVYFHQKNRVPNNVLTELFWKCKNIKKDFLFVFLLVVFFSGRRTVLKYKADDKLQTHKASFVRKGKLISTSQ